MNILVRFVLMLGICFVTNAQAEERLNYFQVDGRYDYRTELLQLALSYSDQSPELIANSKIPVTRAMNLMKKGEITGIVSMATSEKREEDLLAIKIPILAGILGMRVFFIHNEDQAQFSAIEDISDLQNLTAGFGEHWADLKILTENGFKVEPVAKYQSLFNMLNAKRFDYFPRGINEIFGEYETQKKSLKNLIIEQGLAIYYSYPVYFFVSNQDEKLASKIRIGLEKSLADGRFKTLFLDHHHDLLEQLRFEKRRVFHLKNSALPDGAQIKNMHWWFDESKIE